jgi:hypothetical protein
MLQRFNFEPGSAASFIDAASVTCVACNAVGTLNVNGFANTIDLKSAGTSVVDGGLGNTIRAGNQSLLLYGIPGSSTRNQLNSAKADGIAGKYTADYATTGAGGYPSASDLWFWPQDAAFNPYGSPVYNNYIQADSSSPTGYEFIVSGGTSFGSFQQFFSGKWTTASGALTAGTHFPATSAMIYLLAKCPSGTTSFSPGIVVNGTLTGPSAQTCTTNWQLYSYHVTGMSAGTANFGNAFNTATYYVAWYLIKPDAPDYNGYTPAKSGANADITALSGLTTPLSTAQGGTGAGVLTGYRYANGSGADTASTTIPKTAIGGQAGAGAGLTTGPTTSVSGDVVTFTGTSGQVQDSGTALSALAPLASPTFTGNTITLANGAAAEQDLVIKPGSSADQIGAYALANYSGTTQWKLRKDASNYLRLTDSVNSLDRAILYQNGQTILNAGAGSNAVVINGTANSGAGGLLVQSGGASPATVLTVTASGNTTATGFVAGKSYAGAGTMTLAAGAAAGTSPTIACATSHVCDGVSGEVTLTTGTSPTTGTLATLTFPSAHTNYANCIVAVSASAAQQTAVTWSETASAVTLTANSALTASTAYQVRYWCGGN